ncbi:TIGR03915 family putative DNA repair protein [Mucilaginibacter sp. KACC 22773]|uniref:TIGR03915 family putative DNA repair protein n=1 Tax=Mucilaginibacter sp. KACC 22773 TaxID=3025671 RepID=UPI0023670070|nr:TIGR03915 family putative DNA repair protein [Mucilaginibacter sp. KACC 22773]WDF80636.1 TIGR03915 family putative DNA repair protein [Mucilaginibacter sp. KACC 22773]
MYTLVYDGTFEGLLTAVFEIYDRKLFHVKLIKGEWRTSAMFEEVLQVITDEHRANRVLKGLRKKLSAAGIQRLYIAHMAEMENEESAIVGFIRYVFDTDVNVEEDYGNKYVMRLSEILKMVRREKHRMEAFIRFQKLKDETYYAAIEPDFNVLPLIIRHFKNRYTDQKWIIYDIKRRYGIHYDLHDTQYITLDFSEVNKPADVISAFTEDEKIYQQLWKSYFTSVNIVARKNTRLHLRHIPKRYWRHLTEKI